MGLILFFMGPKRHRYVEPSGEWMPFVASVNTLTKDKAELIFCKVFDLPSFPGWSEKAPGHFMVRGQKHVNGDPVCFSFWPSTGSVLFQGKEEVTKRQMSRWREVAASYT